MLRDATSTISSPFWKAVAISTLNTVLSILKTDPAQANSMSIRRSTGYMQTMELIRQKRYLQNLLHISLSKDAGSGELNIDLYRTVLDMCVTIAGDQNGVDLIYDSDFFRLFNSTGSAVAISLLTDDIANGFMSSNLDTEKIFYVLMPALQLFSVMLSVHPHNQQILRGCIDFLHKNETLVLDILGLKHRSLRGLQLIKAILSVLSVVSAFKSVSSNKNTDDVFPSVWGDSSGMRGSSWLLRPLCALLKRIGTIYVTLIFM